MKKMLIIVLFMMTSVSFAMDADQMKAAALKGCTTQLENVPEEMREASKKVCECNVNNTDYAAILAGDTEKAQKDALKVAEACATKAL